MSAGATGWVPGMRRSLVVLAVSSMVALPVVSVGCIDNGTADDAPVRTTAAAPAHRMPDGWPTILAFGPDAEIVSVTDESDDTGHHQAVVARFDDIGQNVFATYRGALQSVGYRMGSNPPTHDPRNLKWALRAKKDNHDVRVQVVHSPDGTVTGTFTHDTSEPREDR